MGNKQRYTPTVVADALRETKGMTTLAARKLGCDYKTIRKYMDRYAVVRDAAKEAREHLGDQVELTLVRQALGKQDNKGDYTELPNTAALIFLAKTKYKDRGYTERTETVNFNVDPDLLKRAIDALEAAGLDPAQAFNDLIEQAARVKQMAGTAGGDEGE